MTENKKDDKKTPPVLPFGSKGNKTKKPKFNFYWIYGILLLIFIGMQFFYNGSTTKKTDWGALQTMLKNGDIQKIVLVNKEFAEIYIEPEKLKEEKYKDVSKKSNFGGEKPQFTYTVISPDKFDEKVAKVQEGMENPVYVQSEARYDWTSDVLNIGFYILLLFGAWYFIMRMMKRGGGGGGQIFNIGKSKAQVYDKNTSVNISFKDVAGLEEAKVEVKEVVDFLKSPEKYTRLGGKIPKGILLV
ncbi:MAG: hypothetical protein DRJ09_08660, partial [Bacteroidetes bacterium]